MTLQTRLSRRQRAPPRHRIPCLVLTPSMPLQAARLPSRQKATRVRCPVLGDSTGSAEAKGPVPSASDVPFTAVSAGDGFSCGLRSDGAVECWGSNYFGQLDVPEESFTAVSSSYSHSCGLRQDGKVECWGSDASGKLDTPDGVYEAVSVGNSEFSCGLRDDGIIRCWGDGLTGEWGASEEGVFMAMYAGYSRVCGLSVSGVVECWNTDGPQICAWRCVHSGVCGRVAFVRAAR